MNVIITGATKGIGRALCNVFATNGWNLAICSRSPDDLSHVIKELNENFPAIRILNRPTDLSRKPEVKAFANFLKENWTEFDVLVNNAGIFVPGSILEEEEDTLREVMDINLYSSYYLTREIVPLMKKRKRGHIINMCSIASFKAYAGGGSYTISKFAMLGFSKVLREDLKPYNIKVTSVLPGATWSHSWIGTEFPRERFMEAEDIASTIFHTVSLGKNAVVEEILIRPQQGDL